MRDSKKHVVVRPLEEGILKKDWSGTKFKWINVIRPVGFNFNNKSIYLCRDVFGEEFLICGTCFSGKNFGDRFCTKESLRKYDQLRRCYCNMFKRCYTTTHISSDNYYFKGVKICDEWLGAMGLTNFILWSIAHGFQLGLTIDKRDKLYSPNTCQWITLSENSRWTSNTKLDKEKVVKIKADYKNHIGSDMAFCRQEASKYSVHPQTIKGVILDIQWRDVN